MNESEWLTRKKRFGTPLANQFELRLAKARRQVGLLTPSLLASVFAGKLVPENLTDEPASALLERIARETKQQTKKRHATTNTY